MNQKMNKQYIIFVCLLAIGIFLRFVVMTFGHNFDFASYCIVGDIAGNLRNVYAETERYNYGPIFFCIQGFLYRLSCALTGNWEWLYRIFIVSTLTLADLGIACFIASRYSMKLATIFFLNPVSIIITGYHNQFDNIAILLAVLTVLFYNEEEKFNKKDVWFIVLLTLCLMTKHILFTIPFFLLLRKGLPLKKRFVYACVPPFLFLLSFVPFALSSRAAFDGIMKNVFLYRSFNNAPLLSPLYDLIHFPSGPKFYIFVISMIVLAFITRAYNYEKMLMIYFVAMVAFSSAIANQYLVIPMVALCVLPVGAFRYVYMGCVGVFLMLERHGFGWLTKIQDVFPTAIGKMAELFVNYGYVIAVWILFAALLYIIIVNNKKNTSVVEI